MRSQQLEQAHCIAIFGHDNPDGDAIGSMLGLGRLLENMGKTVSYHTYPTPSKIFNFVPGIEKIHDSFDYKHKYDLIVFVDFSPYGRTVFTQGQYDYFDRKPLVIIDHHLGDCPAHAIVLKDSEADSNCERIFENTKDIRSDYYDSQVATYLYLGLATDTGNFLYDKQGSRSLHNAAALLDLGADKALITNTIFGTLEMEQVAFFVNVFPRLVRRGDRHHIGYITFRDEDYLSLGLDKSQAGEFLTAMITKIAGIDFMLICRIEPDAIKISFRSKTPSISAEAVARSLGGGGHFYAAGAKVDLILGDDPVEKIEEIVGEIER